MATSRPRRGDDLTPLEGGGGVVVVAVLVLAVLSTATCLLLEVMPA